MPIRQRKNTFVTRYTSKYKPIQKALDVVGVVQEFTVAIGDVLFEEPEELQTYDEVGMTPDKVDSEKWIERVSQILVGLNALRAFVLLGSAIAIAIWAGITGINSSTLYIQILSGFPTYQNMMTPSGFYETQTLLSSYPITYILPILPFIAGLFSLIRILDLRRDYTLWVKYTAPSDRLMHTIYMHNIQRGVGSIRTIEWLFIVPLGFWMIASVVGISDVMILLSFLISSISIVLLLFGHEAFNYIISKYHRKSVVLREEKNLLTKTDIKNAQGYKRGFQAVTKDSRLYLLRSWWGYAGASIVHLWFWIVVIIYWGFAGASNVSAWKLYRWTSIPIVGFLCMLIGIAYFIWTRNQEYEENYIRTHAGVQAYEENGEIKYAKMTDAGIARKKKVGGIEVNEYPTVTRVQSEYVVLNWNNNLRMEIASLILSALAILVFVWVIWTGMLFT